MYKQLYISNIILCIKFVCIYIHIYTYIYIYVLIYIYIYMYLYIYIYVIHTFMYQASVMHGALPRGGAPARPVPMAPFLGRSTSGVAKSPPNGWAAWAAQPGGAARRASVGRRCPDAPIC